MPISFTHTTNVRSQYPTNTTVHFASGRRSESLERELVEAKEFIASDRFQTAAQRHRPSYMQDFADNRSTQEKELDRTELAWREARKINTAAKNDSNMHTVGKDAAESVYQQAKKNLGEVTKTFLNLKQSTSS